MISMEKAITQDTVYIVFTISADLAAGLAVKPDTPFKHCQ
jgi:hypothetical protein